MLQARAAGVGAADADAAGVSELQARTSCRVQNTLQRMWSDNKRGFSP